MEALHLSCGSFVQVNISIIILYQARNEETNLILNPDYWLAGWSQYWSGSVCSPPTPLNPDWPTSCPLSANIFYLSHYKVSENDLSITSLSRPSSSSRSYFLTPLTAHTREGRGPHLVPLSARQTGSTLYGEWGTEWKLVELSSRQNVSST